MNQRIKHLLLITLILPQLLVLGLGRTAVVCVSAGGHMQVEVSASGCCESLPPQAEGAALGADDGGPSTPEDCGSCSDLAVLVDFSGPQRLASFQLDAGPVLPLDFVQSAPLGELEAPGSLPCAPAQLDDPAPPLRSHLARLRCVVLRC